MQTPTAFGSEKSSTTHSKPAAQDPENPKGPPQGSFSTRAQIRQHRQESHTVPAPFGQSDSFTFSHSDKLHTQLKPFPIAFLSAVNVSMKDIINATAGNEYIMYQILALQIGNVLSIEFFTILATRGTKNG